MEPFKSEQRPLVHADNETAQRQDSTPRELPENDLQPKPFAIKPLEQVVLSPYHCSKQQERLPTPRPVIVFQQQPSKTELPAITTGPPLIKEVFQQIKPTPSCQQYFQLQKQPPQPEVTTLNKERPDFFVKPQENNVIVEQQPDPKKELPVPPTGPSKEEILREVYRQLLAKLQPIRWSELEKVPSTTLSQKTETQNNAVDHSALATVLSEDLLFEIYNEVLTRLQRMESSEKPTPQERNSSALVTKPKEAATFKIHPQFSNQVPACPYCRQQKQIPITSPPHSYQKDVVILDEPLRNASYGLFNDDCCLASMFCWSTQHYNNDGCSGDCLFGDCFFTDCLFGDCGDCADMDVADASGDATFCD